MIVYHHGLIGDHSYITSAKGLGGFRKWQFFLTLSTVFNAELGGWVKKNPKICWRNKWMWNAPSSIQNTKADSGTKSRSRRAENCRISKLVYPAQRTSLTVWWLHTKKLFKIRFCTMYSQEIVFCFKICAVLLWEKNVLGVEKNFCRFKAEAENLQNVQDHQDNFFEHWEVTTIYWKIERSEQFIGTLRGMNNLFKQWNNVWKRIHF